MPGFLSPRKGVPLLLIPEYSGINEDQRVPDKSKTAHRKPLVKCFLTFPPILLYFLHSSLYSLLKYIFLVWVKDKGVSFIIVI